MARIDTLANFVTDVANAIRSKSGKSDLISPSDFDIEITNLPSGGADKPEVGFTVDEWDAEGYATKVTVYGMTSVPELAFGLFNQTKGVDILNKNLKEVVLPNNVERIGESAFNRCYNLETINLPNTLIRLGKNCFYECTKLSLTELPNSITGIPDEVFTYCDNLALTKLPSSITGAIGISAFSGCSKITVKTVPDGITVLQVGAFANCTGLIQMSMNNVTTIYGSGSSNSSFRSCTNMKAFWIGSAITSLYRYSLHTGSNLLKIYIDKPRAEVEAFYNYPYAFCNDSTKQGIIVCNDDADFITKEEFDTIDWSVA